MKTLNVIKASALRASFTKNNRAQIILTLEGCEDNLLLSPKQFLVATQDGGRLANLTIDDCYDSDEDQFSADFLAEVASVRGGEIVGNITYHEAGEEYTLDANHPDVKLGKAKAGDKRKFEKAGLSTNGLCTIYSGQITRELNAFAKAKAELSAFKPKVAIGRRIVIENEGDKDPKTAGAFTNVE